MTEGDGDDDDDDARDATWSGSRDLTDQVGLERMDSMSVSLSSAVFEEE